jgi:DeoR/GlpR family transcriptional regulator of sugar metabolism
LSAGTTTFALSERLPDPGATIVTNSVQVMNLFTDGPGADPRVRELPWCSPVGRTAPSDALLVGRWPASPSARCTDTLFLGCHGIDPAAEEPDHAQPAGATTAFVKAARKVTVVADHSWGIVGPESFADLDDVTRSSPVWRPAGRARTAPADRVGPRHRRR